MALGARGGDGSWSVGGGGGRRTPGAPLSGPSGWSWGARPVPWAPQCAGPPTPTEPVRPPGHSSPRALRGPRAARVSPARPRGPGRGARCWFLSRTPTSACGLRVPHRSVLWLLSGRAPPDLPPDTLRPWDGACAQAHRLLGGSGSAGPGPGPGAQGSCSGRSLEHELRGGGGGGTGGTQPLGRWEEGFLLAMLHKPSSLGAGLRGWTSGLAQWEE